MKQPKKCVHSPLTWIVILVASLLFFLSMSALAWGLTCLAQRDLTGIWFLGGGLLLQVAAISSVWGMEKREQTRLIRS